MSGVKRLLEELQAKAREELETPVKIEDYHEFPDVDHLRLEGRRGFALRTWWPSW
jgi:hypothetical protein